MERPERRIGIRSDSQQEVFVELLEEIRGLREEVVAVARKKNGNGNGHGDGWFSKLLTERVIALVIAGLISLTIWVGFTNVRIALNERDIMNGAVMRSDHEGRIRSLEETRRTP